MDLEQDYLEYVIEFSLSMFAISAAYFFNPASLTSWGTLMLIPLLFGYTTFISRNGFKWASMLSFITLVFAPLNPTMAVLAITIALGNVLVSFFAHGETFRDFYGVTLIPLLLTGLVIGGSLYAGTIYSPDFGNEVRDSAAGLVSDQAATVLEETELVEMQKDANTRAVDQVSTTTVMLTQQYILNETRDELSQSDLSAVNSAFNSAQSDIPDRMVEQVEEGQQDTKTVDIASRVEGAIKNLLEGPAIILVIPLIALGFYTLHPVVGFLTALSAKSFALLGREEEKS